VLGVNPVNETGTIGDNAAAALLNGVEEGVLGERTRESTPGVR
jgi:hypothetical protein